ncbi:MAG: biotin/lipoyl-binding protein [Candidatus Paceibacterota bacterium]
MKSIFNTPKIIIPLVAIIAIVAGVVAFRTVGKAPIVNLPAVSEVTASGTIVTNSSDNTVDLAFPKSGRVASVSVKVGDHVVAGQTLAALDAGDAAGVVTQAKGALELAEAQYASQDVQYANAKKQQDVLVQNALRTVRSSGIVATPTVQDDSHIPLITGTYTCSAEGSYVITPYPSGANSGFSFTYSGLESGSGVVTFSTPQPLGSCGLYVQFTQGFAGATKWTIDVPNTKSATYVTNKNNYDLAVTTRDQVLSQFAANLGQNGSSAANTAKAAIDTARGVYQAALGAYKNNVIVAPTSGTVSFIDADLKAGQSVTQSKTVISLTTK